MVKFSVRPPPPIQAAHNATAASRLLDLMKRVDQKVADLMAADALKGEKQDSAGHKQDSAGHGDRSSSINSGLKRLTQVSFGNWRLTVDG